MVLVPKPYSNGNNFFSPIHSPSLIKSVDWKVTDVTKFFLILEQVVPAVSSISCVCCISQVHTLWRQAALPRYMLHQHHQMFFVVCLFFFITDPSHHFPSYIQARYFPGPHGWNAGTTGVSECFCFQNSPFQVMCSLNADYTHVDVTCITSLLYNRPQMEGQSLRVVHWHPAWLHLGSDWQTDFL